MFKHPYIEGSFCLFYVIPSHFLVRGEGEGWQIWHGKMLERGSKNVVLREIPFFNNSYVKILKKNGIFDPQTVIYNKFLFRMENWLLVNRSFDDDSIGKPVRAIAVRSSVLRTFAEDSNSSVSSSAIQFFIYYLTFKKYLLLLFERCLCFASLDKVQEIILQW